MDRSRSQPIHENCRQYDGSPPQGLFEARRAGSFFEWHFCYMLNNKLNDHGDFTPAAVAPPNCDNPEQVIRHLAQRSALLGTGTASHSSYQNFVFHIIVKKSIEPIFSH